MSEDIETRLLRVETELRLMQRQYRTDEEERRRWRDVYEAGQKQAQEWRERADAKLEIIDSARDFFSMGASFARFVRRAARFLLPIVALGSAVYGIFKQMGKTP